MIRRGRFSVVQSWLIHGRLFSHWHLTDNHDHHYDDLGDAHWYLFQFKTTTRSIVLPETEIFITLTRYNGPPLGSPWNSAQVVGTPLAPGYIRFIPPRQMIFTHSLTDTPVTLNLVPFD